MKNLVIAIITLFNVSIAFAAQMTEQDQQEYIRVLAKDLRRDLWRSGHEDVSSVERKVTLEQLNDHVRKENNQNYETPLNRDEISQLFRCYHRVNCELYYVGTSSEYWGGYGAEGHFVLLDVINEKHEMISHVEYAE